MVPEATSPEVREAIEELHLYLSDILPPLVVADAMKLLVQCPASLTASNVRSWTVMQHRLGSDIPISDYIFYALRKIFLVGQYRLVPEEPFDRFLEELKSLVLAFCPESEREALREKLARLPEALETLTASVDALIRHRAGEKASSASGAALTAEQQQGLRIFSLLLERLGRKIGGEGGTGSAKPPDPVVSQALAAAVRGSRYSRDFEHHLERLKELGMVNDTADALRTLGRNVPGWIPPESPDQPAGSSPEVEAETAQRIPVSAPLEAMGRIVAQPEHPAEVARRFNEMVRTAIERFNEGALAQAAAMLEMADQLVREERVDIGTAEAVRRKADEALDFERLRQYAETPRQHSLLRQVLSFFTATSPTGLLDELLRELKRERRKLILQLLEVHGAPVRQEVLVRLQPPFGQGQGDEKWYFRRNLLYLLRRIPPDLGGAPSEEDVEAAARHAVLRLPAPLVKEAVANLAQMKNEKAESALLGLLENLEKMLEKPEASAYDPRQARLLLDRVVAALARLGTGKARRAIVEYGLKRRAGHVAKLAELTGQDLSGDPELVGRLLAALKASSPRKLLGIALHPSDSAKYLIEALSATPLPAVRSAFEDLAKRFPNLEVGKAAAHALSSAGEAGQAPDEARSGELELFGLPAVVQNLAASKLSGNLKLKDPKGKVFGEIVLQDGKMKSCRAQNLVGEEAFYQLVELPAAGTYAFERMAAEEHEATAGSLRDVLQLCLEGMRRYDGFQQALALVPDDMKLKPTAVRPEPHPDEIDGMFVNGLWNLASGGATALECGRSLAAEPYRIRRQLAHWVEMGALKPEN
jgi:hypothetical protein